jgi:hypothetical protein
MADITTWSSVSSIMLRTLSAWPCFILIPRSTFGKTETSITPQLQNWDVNPGVMDPRAGVFPLVIFHAERTIQAHQDDRGCLIHISWTNKTKESYKFRTKLKKGRRVNVGRPKWWINSCSQCIFIKHLPNGQHWARHTGNQQWTLKISVLCCFILMAGSPGMAKSGEILRMTGNPDSILEGFPMP